MLSFRNKENYPGSILTLPLSAALNIHPVINHVELRISDNQLMSLAITFKDCFESHVLKRLFKECKVVCQAVSHCSGTYRRIKDQGPEVIKKISCST